MKKPNYNAPAHAIQLTNADRHDLLRAALASVAPEGTVWQRVVAGVTVQAAHNQMRVYNDACAKLLAKRRRDAKKVAA